MKQAVPLAKVNWTPVIYNKKKMNMLIDINWRLEINAEKTASQLDMCWSSIQQAAKKLNLYGIHVTQGHKCLMQKRFHYC